MQKKPEIIALVSHDGRKMNMMRWANKNRELLERFKLFGTGNTAKKISQITGLKVKELGHGPEGGDITIAYNILKGKIGVLIFFIDTKEPHGHEHDIQALIRAAVTKKILLALNEKTADCIIRHLNS